MKERVSTAEVKSTGPSGIGFVNFGDIDTLDMQAPVVTAGGGARGFNLYGGSLKSASFHSIKTTGDGSVGIQVSKPMGSLTVHHDVVTFEVAEGAAITHFEIGGGIEATGAGSRATDIEGNVPPLDGPLDAEG